MNLQTSKLPWSTDILPEQCAKVLDAQGKTVAIFADWRDAEAVVQLSKEYAKTNNSLPIKG